MASNSSMLVTVLVKKKKCDPDCQEKKKVSQLHQNFAEKLRGKTQEHWMFVLEHFMDSKVRPLCSYVRCQFYVTPSFF